MIENITVKETVRVLGVTPKLSIPVMPTISSISIKFDYKLDFSKYIPIIKF